MKSRKILLLPALFAICCIGYAYFSHLPQQEQTHYITEVARLGDIDKSVLATGSVRASKRTEVGAQVSGNIQKLYVQLGQQVHQGDLIAEIDSQTQQNNLNTAKAELMSYQTQLDAKQLALNIAQSHFQRLNKLYEQKSASLSDLETAKNELAVAKANLEEIKAKIQVAEISVSTAQTNLSYTKISSPIDGVIISVPVSEGQTVNANQASPTIVQVADLAQALVKLEISEGDIAQVQPNQRVTFTTLAEPNRHYQGKIVSVDPALTTLTDNNYTEQSSNSEAVYYYANVLIDNQDRSLRIGMTIQGRIAIAEKQNVLLAPNTAIKKLRDKHFVQVLDNGKVVEKSVEIGLSDSQNSEILSGLTEGEQIIMTQRAENEQVGNNNRNMPMPRF